MKVGVYIGPLCRSQLPDNKNQLIEWVPTMQFALE